MTRHSPAVYESILHVVREATTAESTRPFSEELAGALRHALGCDAELARALRHALGCDAGSYQEWTLSPLVPHLMPAGAYGLG
jgi:hypothetical protein